MSGGRGLRTPQGAFLPLVASLALLACNSSGGGQQDQTKPDFRTQADAGEIVEADDGMGEATAVGDFDGDGFEDLAVGSPGEDGEAGTVSIFPGSEGGITDGYRVTQGSAGEFSEPGDLFGAAMTVGDFDFDGFEDLAVGAPGEALGGGPRAGAVFIFPGGPLGLGAGFVLTEEDFGGLNEDGDEFGAAMATGDVDGNFREDLVIGAPGDAPEGGARSGSVYIIPGSSIGLDPLTAYFISQSQVDPGFGEMNEDGDRFGAALETGQFNGFGGVDVGDGFADLAVGAPGEAPGTDPQSGAVYFFLGSSVGVGNDPPPDPMMPRIGGLGFLITQADATDAAGVPGVNEAGDEFGAELGVGDSTGDGVEELAVGAPGEDARSGSVFVYQGEAVGGVPTLTTSILTQLDAGRMPAPGDEFGAGIAFGVLDQNPFEELAVGAPGSDMDSGLIYTFPGSATGFMMGSIRNQVDAGGVAEIGDRLGEAMSIEDFNDNNAADLAVGAPGMDAAAGAVFLYPGTPTSPPMTDQEAAGGVNESGDRFGAAQATGDFDNDGFPDLAVSATGEDGNAGAVFIFPGAAADPPTATAITITTGFVITQRVAGDFNEPADEFGAALAAGDFNDDGFDDLAIGAPGENGRTGVVFIFRGSPRGLTTGVFISESHGGSFPFMGERFGDAVAAGDFNADGIDDLAVGAPFENRESGMVFVFPGSFPSGIRLGFAITQAEAGDLVEHSDRFGASLAVGNFDGDMIGGNPLEDLVVGATGENAGSGAVFVFPGTVGGIRTGFFITEGHAGIPPEANDLFGTALAEGDINHDGYSDLAVGAPGRNFAAGAAYTFLGSSSGITLGSLIDQSHAGDVDAAGERFGAAVAFGDGDGDGCDDLVVGAPGGRVVVPTGGPLPPTIGAGVAFLFPGTDGLPRSDPPVALECGEHPAPGIDLGFPLEQAGNGGANEEGDALGASLAFANFDGDVSEDTGLPIDDLAIGATGEAPGGPSVATSGTWAGFAKPTSGALFLVDDGELERLFDEFRRLQGTGDPLPPPPF